MVRSLVVSRTKGRSVTETRKKKEMELKGPDRGEEKGIVNLWPKAHACKGGNRDRLCG